MTQFRPWTWLGIAMLATSPLLGTACSSHNQTAKSPSAADAERVPKVDATIAAFKAKDPSVERFFGASAGYVVMPTIGEGGYIVGGGYGQGEAFEAGSYVGKVKLVELSVGALVGGQSYSQIVFFQHADDFQRLKQGSFQFGAEVTAIAADKGVAKNADFVDGVATFILPKKGLMASASVGGNRLRFEAAK